MQRYSSSEF